MNDIDREELAVVDEEATMEELQQLEDAELVVRDKMASGPPTWRMRHATLKDVAYTSLPKRERLRLHTLVARYLLEKSHRSTAADHFDLAARASLPLHPLARS